jgi:hypothetical protein
VGKKNATADAQTICGPAERLRKGGQQVVDVQHIDVSGAAKAVVAGSVEGGLLGGAKWES